MKSIQPSFHSISFPSEWGGKIIGICRRDNTPVSIQLVSPASGELPGNWDLHNRGLCSGFHSISFPSEWGDNNCLCPKCASESFHSISFPSEWGETEDDAIADCKQVSFHSISFPSEWGAIYGVSTLVKLITRFHSISFPSEWGANVW